MLVYTVEVSSVLFIDFDRDQNKIIYKYNFIQIPIENYSLA